jgi:hypothetical protein
MAWEGKMKQERLSTRKIGLDGLVHKFLVVDQKLWTEYAHKDLHYVWNYPACLGDILRRDHSADRKAWI